MVKLEGFSARPCRYVFEKSMIYQETILACPLNRRCRSPDRRVSEPNLAGYAPAMRGSFAMTDLACEGESFEDLVARLSDVLRFVFDQQQEDIVVLVGDDGVNRALVSQLEEKAAPSLRDAVSQPDVLSGRTRIRRINETLHVVV